MADYSRTIFDKGIVCFNTNNYTKCIVINGHLGTESDRTSKVLEHAGFDGLMFNNVPNRALVPTGEYIDIPALEKKLFILSSDFEKIVYPDKENN